MLAYKTEKAQEYWQWMNNFTSFFPASLWILQDLLHPYHYFQGSKGGCLQLHQNPSFSASEEHFLSVA